MSERLPEDLRRLLLDMADAHFRKGFEHAKHYPEKLTRRIPAVEEASKNATERFFELEKAIAERIK